MIIELAGPPGSGKSTLAKTLLEHKSSTELVTYPYFRRPADILFFARNFVLLMPTLAKLRRHSEKRRLSRRDVALMTILNGWHKSLIQKSKKNGRTIVLEEGGICLMAKLHCFGSDLIKSQLASPWWTRIYTQWGQALSLVVFLDVPGPELVARVRSRNVAHEISDLTDAEAVRWFESLQAGQESMIAQLQAKGSKLKVFRANSGIQSTEKIHKDLLTMMREDQKDL